MASTLRTVAMADDPSTVDAFRVTQQLVDAAVPAVADIAVVEVAQSALCEHSALSQACGEVSFRRAAFRGVNHAESAYRIGEASPVPSGTPYRRSIRDMRSRIVSPVPERAAWLERDRVRAGVMRENRVHSLMVVPLTANHSVLGLVAFYRRAGSSPFRQTDLRAATELTQNAARTLGAIRRDLQEQGMGRRFQHILLAQPPRLSALEDIHGHVPEKGTPGGWFDVIRLPSARVGLVAGFCSGRGIAAAAAMSQHRAQIRALAAQDMDPGEVLTRSLEPAAREPDAKDPPSAAAHCVYAVYDPVTRHCTTAHTGLAHVTVVDADGAQSIAPPTQAPAAHETYDVTEFDVPPGSLLALTCANPHELQNDAPGHQAPTTPAVTLTARTRATPPTDIATWNLPNEPSAVADARARTAAQLTSWKLPDLSFTATLVVSELVTNAIRYSTGPIQLRLIRDHALICEVSDTSRAAPHAGEPAPNEQNGRGLSIVAHLTHGYGTRYTTTGKTVWTELTLYETDP
ncbi:SpoIIE family protein phosphatase [Streptomyces sp. NPDC004528]|uniref:ATP-binding SpoIIE family protein phosphatase n=1 Tax=Streptomyces sp. NPDC004528 TaxID=3154550 RepID=UPI0033BB001D